MEENQIVPIEKEIMLGAIPMEPKEVIHRASEIATELAKIINQRKLFKVISDRKYVHVEGWSTLGAMLGVLPLEKSVVKIDNGYEAYVQLIRSKDGQTVGGASAICTRDERNWHNRDEYAVRSMAITRATGKAYRLGFSWIMQLAGYEVTPAEEIPQEAIDVQAQEPPSPTLPKKHVWTQDQRNGLIMAGLAKNDFGAKGMLGLSTLPEGASPELISEWGRRYREVRPLDPTPESPTSQAAADIANAWYTQYKESVK